MVSFLPLNYEDFSCQQKLVSTVIASFLENIPIISENIQKKLKIYLKIETLIKKLITSVVSNYRILLLLF